MIIIFNGKTFPSFCHQKPSSVSRTGFIKSLDPGTEADTIKMDPPYQHLGLVELPDPILGCGSPQFRNRSFDNVLYTGGIFLCNCVSLTLCILKQCCRAGGESREAEIKLPPGAKAESINCGSGSSSGSDSRSGSGSIYHRLEKFFWKKIAVADLVSVNFYNLIPLLTKLYRSRGAIWICGSVEPEPKKFFSAPKYCLNEIW
jgi:hypothetical protein